MLESSLDRPAWTSTPETGGLTAYKHRHSLRGFEPYYYGRTEGFETRRHAVELREN